MTTLHPRIDEMLTLWRRYRNTAEIASELRLHEAEVARAIADERDVRLATMPIYAWAQRFQVSKGTACKQQHAFRSEIFNRGRDSAA